MPGCHSQYSANYEKPIDNRPQAASQPHIGATEILLPGALEMKLERIILRQIRMPLVHFFETSFGRTTDRHMVLVEAVGEGASGWGEVTAGENPFYNEEWTHSAWHILRDYAAPLVLGRELKSAAEVSTLTARIRGHLMARGGSGTSKRARKTNPCGNESAVGPARKSPVASPSVSRSQSPSF